MQKTHTSFATLGEVSEVPPNEFFLIRSEFVIRITGLEQDRKSSRERLHLEDAECQVSNRDFGLGCLALNLSGLYHVFARGDTMRK